MYAHTCAIVYVRFSRIPRWACHQFTSRRGSWNCRLIASYRTLQVFLAVSISLFQKISGVQKVTWRSTHIDFQRMKMALTVVVYVKEEPPPRTIWGLSIDDGKAPPRATTRTVMSLTNCCELNVRSVRNQSIQQSCAKANRLGVGWTKKMESGILHEYLASRLSTQR